MKLVTWNLQWGCGIDGRVDFARIVKAARAMADFDVFCVQEVADNFPGLAGNDDRDQFAELSRLLPGFGLVAAPAVDIASDDAKRRRFGVAIYSRLPVISSRAHALPWPADPGKKSMPRTAVEATLATTTGPVRVTTTHLEYYSEVQRNAQAARLRELNDEACDRAARPGARTKERGPFDATAQATIRDHHRRLQLQDRQRRLCRDPARRCGPPIATRGPSRIPACRMRRPSACTIAAYSEGALLLRFHLRDRRPQRRASSAACP